MGILTKMSAVVSTINTNWIKQLSVFSGGRDATLRMK